MARKVPPMAQRLKATTEKPRVSSINPMARQRLAVVHISTRKFNRLKCRMVVFETLSTKFQIIMEMQISRWIVRVKLHYRRIKRQLVRLSTLSCQCRLLPNLVTLSNWNTRSFGISRHKIIGARRELRRISSVIEVLVETLKLCKILDRVQTSSRRRSCCNNNCKERRKFCILPRTRMPVVKTNTILIS